jgi:hypothetical protein
MLRTSTPPPDPAQADRQADDPNRTGTAQIALITALLGGFRYAIRRPAELRANWTIQMAWLSEHRSFLVGSKRAASLALIALPLVLSRVRRAAQERQA